MTRRNASKPNKKWLQSAFNKHKKGTLHFLLDVPNGKKIPMYKLKQAIQKKNPLHLRRMAQLVINSKKISENRVRY
jgi:hypothetical protein